VAKKQASPDVGRRLAERALPLLEAAALGDPQDAPAGEAAAAALRLVGRPDAALEVCTAVLQNNPESETTLFLAAGLAAQLRRHADVRAYAERGARVNPWLWQFRQMLAEAYASEGNWAQAAEACRQALRLHPANLAGRQLLLRCYLELGDRVRARGELGACLALLPPAQRDEFRRRVEPQLR
jgi:tetratricopeptide (TPR) repeat protein